MKEIDRVRNYDKLPDEESALKAEAYPPQVEESDIQAHPDASKPKNGFRISPRVVGLILRVLWPCVVKFFPWLGWLSVIVYLIIDVLSKH